MREEIDGNVDRGSIVFFGVGNEVKVKLPNFEQT